jgi:2-haloacid dehalogenase
MLDLRHYEVLSFDCYGTLIDWEGGIARALQPVLAAHGVELDAGRLIELYAEAEAAAEAGPYRRYREVLRTVAAAIAARLGFELSAAERDVLPDSLQDWPPFPDTVEALRALKRRYRLAVVSNVDDDLFAGTARQLGVELDWLITAQQAGSYKPSRNNFLLARRVMGVESGRQLHVAQSLYHDILPANALGIDCVWVNRKGARHGVGPETAGARPDLEVPDLATLARLAERSASREV